MVDAEQLLWSLVECSEQVRQAVISAEREFLSKVVGMGADGAATSGIDKIAEDIAIGFFDGLVDPVNVLSEEVGLIDRGSSITVIVDPIDATANATASAELGTADTPDTLHVLSPTLPDQSGQFGFPFYAFSVGALQDGKLIAACVRNLPTGDLFTAVRGGGSRMNGVAIRCEPITDMRKAWIALVRPADAEGLRRSSRLMLNSNRVRITGCTALDLCMIASGVLHGFANPNIHWPPNFGEKVVDYAGALLILEEAGAVASDQDGKPLSLTLDLLARTMPFAASTPELLQSMLEAVR
ncbi:MAG TPA: inositol monophosphatase family protein [Nitrolancea sp.]|nr:inositol monophosphatase family protein [Nitrolancea sp.]